MSWRERGGERERTITQKRTFEDYRCLSFSQGKRKKKEIDNQLAQLDTQRALFLHCIHTPIHTERDENIVVPLQQLGA